MNKSILITIALSVLVLVTHAQSVTRIEYFIDTDPGYGQGVAIALSAGDEISFEADLSNVSPGFHILYVRAQNSFGNWSHMQSQGFYVRQGSGSADITHLRYVFNDGTDFSEVYQYDLPEPSANIDIVMPADISFLVPGVQYVMSLVAFSTNGTPGVIETMSFVYETNTPPIATGSVADQSVSREAIDLIIVDDLNSLFNDPDGDILTFSASSDPIDIVSVEVSGTALSVTALSAGDTEIEIIADDGKGGTALISFDLSVNETVTALGDDLSSLKVFPIPVHDRLTVQSSELDRGINEVITLSDLSGKRHVVTAHYADNEITLDLSFLEGGIYVLKINHSTYRIIKN